MREDYLPLPRPLTLLLLALVGPYRIYIVSLYCLANSVSRHRHSHQAAVSGAILKRKDICFFFSFSDRVLEIYPFEKSLGNDYGSKFNFCHKNICLERFLEIIYVNAYE